MARVSDILQQIHEAMGSSRSGALKIINKPGITTPDSDISSKSMQGAAASGYVDPSIDKPQEPGSGSGLNGVRKALGTAIGMHPADTSGNSTPPLSTDNPPPKTNIPTPTPRPSSFSAAGSTGSSSGSSFKDAFALARSAAKSAGNASGGSFSYNGKSYQTNIAGEKYTPAVKQTSTDSGPPTSNIPTPTPRPSDLGTSSPIPPSQNFRLPTSVATSTPTAKQNGTVVPSTNVSTEIGGTTNTSDTPVTKMTSGTSDDSDTKGKTSMNNKKGNVGDTSGISDSYLMKSILSIQDSANPFATVKKQVLDEGKRLVGTHTGNNSNRSAKVYHDGDWKEYVVRHYSGKTHHEDADYHTDNADDAHGAAKHWCKSLKEDTEDLAEISKELAGKYAVKALANRAKEGEKNISIQKDRNTSHSRYAHQKKLGPATEYGETSDEHKRRLDRLSNRMKNKDSEYKDSDRKYNNRSVGLSRAGKTLAKEDAEFSEAEIAFINSIMEK